MNTVQLKRELSIDRARSQDWMTVTSVATSTFIADTTLMLRDDLLANITDPIQSSRAGNEKFVMTEYPQRAVRYPIITVKSENVTPGMRMGMQSVLYYTDMNMEVRVWARNVLERDQLSQQVINRIRSVSISTYDAGGLYDLNLIAAVNVDEQGDAGLHSKVMKLTFKFILGS